MQKIQFFLLSTAYCLLPASFRSIRRNLILILFNFSFLIFNCLHAQPTFIWAKKMGGLSLDMGTSIAVDGLGNVLTTGYFGDNLFNTADFNPGSGTFNLISAGKSDIFVSKLSFLGNFIWARRWGGSSDDWGTSIAVDGSGNVFTTAYFNGIADVIPGPGAFNVTSRGATDIFINKMDPFGTHVWAKRIGGTLEDKAHSIALDGSGNVLTTGFFRGTANFNPGFVPVNLTSAGGADIFVSKLNAAGNFVWAKRMGGALNDVGKSIVVDDSGNVYITGYFQDTADFDPGIGVFNMTSAGGTDVFVSKLDLLGNFVWAKQMGGAFSEQGTSIAVDGSGNVYTTGYFILTVDFDPGPGIFNMTAANLTDIFVSKLDLLGNFVWAFRMGGIEDEYGSSIALDDSANVYVMGDQYSDSVDFDPDPGIYNVYNPAAVFPMVNEANFVAKYDSSGNLRCAFAITPGHNETHGDRHIAVAGSNIYIAAGFINGSIADFNPCPPVYNLPSAGGSNSIYVAKYDMSGGCNCLPPVVNFTASDTVICKDSCISFTDLSTNNPSSWQWIFSGAIPTTSIAKNPTNICYNTPGIYEVELVATNANNAGILIKTGYIQVDSCSPPTANFTASDTVICVDSCISFTDLSTDTPSIWQWSFPGAVPSSDTVQNPANICYDTIGIYNVQLITTNVFGSDTLLKTIYIQVDSCPPPTVNFTASDTIICEGDCINFTDLSTDTPTSWQWIFPGGILSTSTAQNPTNICYNDTGVFDIQLIATSVNGSDTLTKIFYIAVYPFPMVDLGKDTTVCAGDSVILDAGANPGAGFNWSTGDTTQTITVSDSSSYFVQVTDNNCTTNDTININVEDCTENTFFLPNSFSPNNDGVNDVLLVRGSRIKNIKLFIYNRWGEKIFQCSMLNVQCSEGWDGTYKGKPLNTAVFAWYVEVEFEDDSKVYRKGNVTLVR